METGILVLAVVFVTTLLYFGGQVGNSTIELAIEEEEV